MPTKRDFLRMLAAGHGRAARLVLSKGGEKFRTQVIKACFEDRRYCTDTCADMGTYLARLLIHLDIDIVRDLERFVKGNAHKIDRAFACSVLAALADKQFRQSEMSLWRCVKHTLKQKHVFAAQEWIQLRKRRGFEDVFSIIEGMRGDLAWAEYAYWTASSVLRFKSDRVLSKMCPRSHEAITRPDPQRPTYHTFEAFFEYAKKSRPPSYEYSRFAREVDPSEYIKAAAAIRTTKNVKVLEGLLNIFSSPARSYQGDPDLLISLCSHRSRRIRWKAFRALRNVPQPKVRQFAEMCLNSRRELWFVIDLFETNYKRGDINKLWDLAISEPQKLPTHDFVMYLTSEKIIEKREVIEALKWAYVASNCSACRSSVVWRLADKGKLPQAWKQELMFDSESDCRAEGRKL